MTPKRYSYYFGIDPGVETGVALWDKENRELIRVKSMKIHEAMDLLNTWCLMNVFVRLEDARLRKWIPLQATGSRERGRREGAGSIKRDCSIWQDFLDSLDIDYEMVPPKNNKTKVSHDYFVRITGWRGSTNDHGRDAAMLVYGY